MTVDRETRKIHLMHCLAIELIHLWKKEYQRVNGREGYARYNRGWYTILESGTKLRKRDFIDYILNLEGRPSKTTYTIQGPTDIGMSKKEKQIKDLLTIHETISVDLSSHWLHIHLDNEQVLEIDVNQIGWDRYELRVEVSK